MSDIDGRIAALEAELAALKASVAANAPDEDGTSRRHLLRNLAVGAAGVAATAGGALKFAAPAAAVNNDPLTLGVIANTATAPTATNATLAASGQRRAVRVGHARGGSGERVPGRPRCALVQPELPPRRLRVHQPERRLRCG